MRTLIAGFLACFSSGVLAQSLPQRVTPLGGVTVTFEPGGKASVSVDPNGVLLEDGRSVWLKDGDWLVSSVPDIAAPASIADCVHRPQPANRLKCFDAVAKLPQPVAAKVAMQERERPIPANEAKAIPVSASDLGIGTRKFDGKLIEMSGLSCVHADTDDYRCVTGASVTIFAKAVEPAGSREHMERVCGSVEKALRTAACKFTVRFVVGERDEDIISGYQKRTVMKVESMWAAEERRRRR